MYCKKKKKKIPPPQKPPPKKNHPPLKKKSPPLKNPKKNPPPKNVQNKGGLNCTVDRGSCAADALLFIYITQHKNTQDSTMYNFHYTLMYMNNLYFETYSVIFLWKPI